MNVEETIYIRNTFFVRLSEDPGPETFWPISRNYLWTPRGQSTGLRLIYFPSSCVFNNEQKVRNGTGNLTTLASHRIKYDPLNIILNYV